MRKQILTVLSYFGHFGYAPSFDEIFTFFPQKIGKKTLKIALKKEVEKGRVVRMSAKMNRTMFGPLLCSPTTYNLQPTTSFYTLPQYSISLVKSEKLKAESSIKKIPINLQRYFSFLRVIPLVRFVGVTGRSAMQGYRENDDVDICIVTKQHYLWTTRFFVVLFAKLLRIHGGKGVCLNLFFDESDLAIPNRKQNSYIGHEILQMKTVIDKDNIIRGFLSQNEWVSSYFPNAVKNSLELKAKSLKLKATLSYPLPPTPYNLQPKTHSLESLLKSLQLPLIIRNKTSFLITPTQLWLFKNDYEKKLKRKGLVL